MKTKILAVVIFAVTVTAVFVNTYFLDKVIKETYTAVESLEISGNDEQATAEAMEIYEGYKRRETYISLSVSHSDLTNIDETFAEMIGQLRVGATEDAEVTKSRLINVLGHLRRLSGVNIDSII